jgi:hypothetical protein
VRAGLDTQAVAVEVLVQASADDGTAAETPAPA